MNKAKFFRTFLLLCKLLIFIGSGHQLIAQTSKNPVLIPYRKGNLWGYADSSRKLIIQPVFEQANLFKGSLAVVKQNNKYGLLKRNGEFLAEPKYEGFYPSGNGFLTFYKDSPSGFIDTLGNETIPEKYRDASKFPTYINRNGKALNEFTFTEVKAFKNNRAVAIYRDKKERYRQTIIDKNGQDQLDPKYTIINTLQVQNQNNYLVSRVSRRNKITRGNKDPKYKLGLLNDKLEIIIPVKFRTIEEKHNFLIVWDGFGKAGLWDYTNRKKLTRRRFGNIETTGKPSRAIVSVLRKRGLIDSTGKYIIPLDNHNITLEDRYATQVQDFKSLGLRYPNIYYIFKNGKQTAVDPFGQAKENFSNGTLDKLTDSLFLVRNKRLVKYEGDSYSYYEQEPDLGLMNVEGKMLVPPAYRYAEVQDRNSLVILMHQNLKSYFSSSGIHLADRKPSRSFIPGTQYQELPKFIPQSELAKDSLKSCFYVHQKLLKGKAIIGNTCLYTLHSFGLVNATGEVIIPFIYNSIYPLSATTLAVKQASLWGVLSIEGKPILPVIFDNIIKLDSGSFMTAKIENGKAQYYLRDSTGRKISQDVFFSYPILTNKYKASWIPIKGGQVKLSRSGKILARKTDIPGFSNDLVMPGIYRYNDDKNWSFIDTLGKTIIPKKYTNVKPFNEGLAPVAKGDKWGYIDKNNQVIIPFSFELVQPFSEGKAFVKATTASGFQVISKTGKVLFKAPYQDVKPFKEGLAPVYQHGKWGFIDTKGKLVIPNRYNYVSDFKEGLAIYALPAGRGLLDKNGHQVTPPKFKDLRPYYNNFISIDNGKNDLGYIINHQGILVDSIDIYTVRNKNEESGIRFENNQLFRINPNGSKIQLGNYLEALTESEGLIGVKAYESLWYYVDENGNKFYEE